MEITTKTPVIYRVSFIYDVIAGIGLTTPWTYTVVYGLVVLLNGTIFGSPVEVVSHSAGDIFFANIGGLALCAWAVARALRYDASYLCVDGVLKLLIVAMQIIAVMNGAPTILLFLGFALFLIGVIELVAYRRLSATDSKSEGAAT